MDERLEKLADDLRALHEELRGQTLERFGRINPFAEDLFDWKERGRAWTRDDRGVTIYNSTTVVGDVEIGQDTWIGPYCSLDGTGGLRIGRHCSISLGSQLLSHDTAEWALSGGKQGYRYATTTIGDYCFIGTLAIVTNGVTIGERSLVAAGAVVTDDVAACSVVAGVPARTIGAVELNEDGSVSLRYD